MLHYFCALDSPCSFRGTPKESCLRLRIEKCHYVGDWDRLGCREVGATRIHDELVSIAPNFFYKFKCAQFSSADRRSSGASMRVRRDQLQPADQPKWVDRAQSALKSARKWTEFQILGPQIAKSQTPTRSFPEPFSAM